jgi:hypothetical protein
MVGNPKNLVILLGAGSVAGKQGLPAGQLALTLALFTLIATAPFLVMVGYLALGGKSAAQNLERWREWLLRNNHPQVKATRAGRRRGTAKLLRWLDSFPGDTWQQRWDASGAEERPGSSWLQLPLNWLRENGLAASYDANDLSSGLLMLICGDVIRPGLAWMVTRGHKHLAPVMAEVRDPAGFARLRELAESGPPPRSAWWIHSADGGQAWVVFAVVVLADP